MARKNTETKTDPIETLLTKVVTIDDWKGKPIQCLPMEGEAAETALAKITEKYPNVDGTKGIFQAIHESGKRLVFANCTENPEEPIGFVRTSDLFQVRFGPTARANRPRSKGKKGGNAANLKALAERLSS